MKGFVLAAAVTLSVGFVGAGKADAQIVYGYSVPGYGGIYSNRTVLGVGASQSYNSFYSPYTGVFQNQVSGSNWLGQNYGRAYGYNPWTGLGYNYGFYQPNTYIMPYGGYNFGFVRRWGW